MSSRKRLAITVLSVCGATAAGVTFYGFRHKIHEFRPVTTPTTGDMTLKSVQIFFRHGARTPLTNITGLDEVRMRNCRMNFVIPFFLSIFAFSLRLNVISEVRRVHGSIIWATIRLGD